MTTTHVLAEHAHTVLHEASDTFVTIHARAVDQGAYGPSVHLGDWSMSADDARLLAATLTLLADATEPTPPTLAVAIALALAEQLAPLADGLRDLAAAIAARSEA